MMNRFFNNIDFRKLSTLGLILGALSTIAQLLSLNKNIVIPFAILSLIIIVVAVIVNYKSKPLPLIRTTNIGSRINVRKVITPAEFEQLDKLYHHCFGGASVPTEVLKSWWINFPEGLIILLKDGEVIGGSSIWSIDDSTFEKIKNGYIREKDILGNNMDLESCDKWYISEIAIASRHRNINNLIELMKGILLKIESLANEIYPIQLLALGYSQEGISLMKRFGFLKELNAEKTADKLPLYRLEIASSSELKAVLTGLNALIFK